VIHNLILAYILKELDCTVAQYLMLYRDMKFVGCVLFGNHTDVVCEILYG